MRLLRGVTIGLLSVAAIQAVASFALLSWAIPRFGNPPMLGNGAARVAGQLRELSQQDPAGFESIVGVDQTFLWFFHGHMHGVELVLAGGFALALSAAASLVFAALLFFGFRASQGPAPNISLKRTNQSLRD